MATPSRASGRLARLDFQLMRVDTPRDGSQAHTSTAAQQLGSSDGRKQRSSEKKIGKHFALPCLCEDSRCVEIRNAHIVGHQTVALDKEPRRARAQVYAVADMVNRGNPGQLTEQRCCQRCAAVAHNKAGRTSSSVIGRINGAGMGGTLPFAVTTAVVAG